MSVKGSCIWACTCVFSLSFVLGNFYVCFTTVYKMIIRELWDYVFILMRFPKCGLFHIFSLRWKGKVFNLGMRHFTVTHSPVEPLPVARSQKISQLHLAPDRGIQETLHNCTQQDNRDIKGRWGTIQKSHYASPGFVSAGNVSINTD